MCFPWLSLCSAILWFVQLYVKAAGFLPPVETEMKKKTRKKIMMIKMLIEKIRWQVLST